MHNFDKLNKTLADDGSIPRPGGGVVPFVKTRLISARSLSIILMPLNDSNFLYLLIVALVMSSSTDKVQDPHKRTSTIRPIIDFRIIG